MKNLFQKSISKITKIIILLSIFIFITQNSFAVNPQELEISLDEQPFSDITKKSLFKDYNELKEKGIILGYPDGTFRPKNTINRAEFLKIVLENEGLREKVQKYENYDSPFPDIQKGSWYTPYVNYAYVNGIINGYPDGTFDPEKNINYFELAKIIVEVSNLELPDYEFKEWYTKYTFGLLNLAVPDIMNNFDEKTYSSYDEGIASQKEELINLPINREDVIEIISTINSTKSSPDYQNLDFKENSKNGNYLNKSNPQTVQAEFIINEKDYQVLKTDLKSREVESENGYDFRNHDFSEIWGKFEIGPSGPLSWTEGTKIEDYKMERFGFSLGDKDRNFIAEEKDLARFPNLNQEFLNNLSSWQGHYTIDDNLYSWASYNDKTLTEKIEDGSIDWDPEYNFYRFHFFKNGELIFSKYLEPGAESPVFQALEILGKPAYTVREIIDIEDYAPETGEREINIIWDDINFNEEHDLDGSHTPFEYNEKVGFIAQKDGKKFIIYDGEKITEEFDAIETYHCQWKTCYPFSIRSIEPLKEVSGSSSENEDLKEKGYLVFMARNGYAQKYFDYYKESAEEIEYFFIKVKLK